MQTRLKAKEKNETGKGISRKLRNAGHVPAVVYGPLMESKSIYMDHAEVERVLFLGGGRKILDMVIEGETEPFNCQVMFKDIHRHPVNRDILHIDFYKIEKGHEIFATVPVLLTGKAVGVVEQAGALQFLSRRLKIKCLPRNLPESIEIDITNMKLGDSLNVEDINNYPDFEIVEEPHRVVASVVSIRAATLEETDEEEGGEEEATSQEATE